MTYKPTIVIVAVFLATSGAAGRETTPSSSIVPFTISSSGGSPRPIVTVRFNNQPMQMMVHSNAGFFAQLRHQQAATFGVTLTGEHKAYGIDKPGHVSDLGFDRGFADRLTVGHTVFRNAPISIFEVPQSDYGMLGIDWIYKSRLILDYVRNQALVSPTASQVVSREAALRRAGYIALPMEYDANNQRYLINVRINGVSRSMIVASASEFTIDSEFARLAHVTVGGDQGSGSGPTGTHVASYALKSPVRIQIGSWTSLPIMEGGVEDTYGYTDQKRPSNPERSTGGYLGGEFFLKTGAVIDFGSRTLYVRRS